MTEKPVARITFTCGEKNYSYRAIINNQKISHVGIRENHSKDSMIPEVIMSYERFWMQLKATREKCIADGMPYDITFEYKTEEVTDLLEIVGNYKDF